MLSTLYHDPLIKDHSCRILGNLIRRKAESDPDKRIFTFTDNGKNDIRLTYSDLEEKSNLFSQAFIDMGLQIGDHVATLMENIPEALITIIACSKTGTILVPLDTRVLNLEKKLHFFLETSRSKAIFVSDKYLNDLMFFLNKYSKSLPQLKIIFTPTAEWDEKFFKFPVATTAEWADRSLATIDIKLKDENSHLVIFFTSGTTGTPKGILWTNAHYTSFGRFPGILGYNPEEKDYKIYTGLPLCHSNAHGITVMNSIWNGFEAVINRKWSLSQLWPLTRQYNIRSFCTIGNMALEIYRYSKAQETVQNPVDHIVDGGLPGYLWAEFYSKFKVHILEAYSQADGGATSVNPPSRSIDGRGQKIGSIGKPVWGWEMEIFDKDDCPCPASIFDSKGKVSNLNQALGEIVSRRKNSIAPPVTYLNNEEESIQKTQKGWHRSGDFGYKDRDGFFYLCHREGENIRRSGKFLDNFDLELIQKIISDDPEVYMAHIFPIMSMDGIKAENDMVAAIIPEQERRIDISVIISRCKEKLPSSLYYPNFFLILDVLPKTRTGKIQNGRLRELFDSGKCVVFAFNEFDNSEITA